MFLYSEEEKPRKTIIEKGQNPLGIIIRQGQSNGIFVVGVNEGSVASKVGLRCGDQLLEVGLNNVIVSWYIDERQAAEREREIGRQKIWFKTRKANRWASIIFFIYFFFLEEKFL